jgi:hypothetical protein
MEEKHIYSTSGWYKFFKLLKSYKKAAKELLAGLSKPKPKKPQVDIQSKTSRTQLPSLPKAKPKLDKAIRKEEVKLKSPKQYSDTQLKILIYALFAAIIALMGLGIYMSAVPH